MSIPIGMVPIILTLVAKALLPKLMFVINNFHNVIHKNSLQINKITYLQFDNFTI